MMWKELLRTRFIQPGEQKAKQGFYCSLQLPNGSYRENGAGLLTEVRGERTRGTSYFKRGSSCMSEMGEKKKKKELSDTGKRAHRGCAVSDMEIFKTWWDTALSKPALNWN